MLVVTGNSSEKEELQGISSRKINHLKMFIQKQRYVTVLWSADRMEIYNVVRLKTISRASLCFCSPIYFCFRGPSVQQVFTIIQKTPTIFQQEYCVQNRNVNQAALTIYITIASSRVGITNQPCLQMI